MKPNSLQRDTAARQRAWLAACLTTLTLLTIPAVYWFSRHATVQSEVHRELLDVGSVIESLIDSRLTSFEMILRGVKGFIEGSEDVSVDEFRRFVESLDTDRVAPGLQGVGFAAYVRAAQREAHVQERRRLGHPDYEIRTSGNAEHWAPIILMEPASRGNRATIGHDVFTNPQARATAVLAAQTGQATITPRLQLLQDSEGPFVPGAVMYLPVYRHQTDDPARSATTGSRAARESRPDAPALSPELLGWADAPFRLQDLLAPLAESLPAGLRLQVYDGNSQGASTHVFGMLDGTRLPRHIVADPEADRVAGGVQFGDQRWTYALEATPTFVSVHDTRTHHWIAALGALLSLSAGLIVWLLMTARDRALAIAADMSRELYTLSASMEATLNAIPDLLFEMDAQGIYRSFRSISNDGLPVPVDGLIGSSVHEILPRASAEAVLEAIAEAARTGRSLGRRITLEINGAQRWFELSVAKKIVDADEEPRFIVISRDISKRQEAENKVEQLAYTDSVTRLPNRAMFVTSATRALQQSRAQGWLGAAVLIDLDNFKNINDHWGHGIGDVVLGQVAARIRECVPQQHTVARLGGDEFIVVLRELGQDAAEAIGAIEDVCRRIQAALAAPFCIEKMEFFASASMGIAMYGESPMTLDELLSRADSAMYSAKAGGRNAFRFYDGTLQAQLAERAALDVELRQALERKELHLVYQPQVDGEGRTVGAEALCRWTHPTRGPVSPAQFIPLAEDNGYILAIGQWVLHNACETLARWQAQPEAAQLRMAVNVSARQFHHPEFVDHVIGALRRAGARPDGLQLELTESIVAQDVEGIANKMAALKALGVSFSLDDFGTGYSSLSYLKRLPIDQLKIDQSFVRDVLVDPSDATIVRTVIALGRSLGLEVIAEGVETEEQRQFLRDNGCLNYQGYLFGRPSGESALLARLKN